jgi:hypothetical protein
VRATHGQTRIVLADGFRSYEHRIHVRAKLTGVAPGGRPGDPARLDRRPRQPAIERHPALRDHKRAPGDNPVVKSLIKLRAILCQNALSHIQTGISQLRDASAGVPRVYVNRADNYPSNASADYRICAWSSASRCRTRLQSNIQRSARRHGRTEIAEALNLSVIATRFAMMPFRYYSIVYDQNRSHSRIRARLAKRLSCLV